MLAFVLLVIGISMAVRIPSVQNFVIQQALTVVSSQTDAEVRIGSFSWSMLRDLNLHDFYLGNEKGDTLIYAHTLNIDFNNWSFFKKQIKISALRLQDAKIYMEADTSGRLNIASLFSKKATTQAQQDTVKSVSFDWATSLDEVFFENVVFAFKDDKKKHQIYLNLPEFALRLDETNIAEKHIAVRSLAIEKPQVVFTKFDSIPKEADDGTRFHFLPEDWRITWDDISVSDGKFAFHANYKPVKEGATDFNHIAVSEINFATEKGTLFRDSLKTKITQLKAKEKSGLQIKSSKGDVMVSLTEVRYSDFVLNTPNSSIGNQFALKYNRFDDFNFFLSKVAIVANVKNSRVSLKDLNYVVKGLEPLAHNTISVSGKVKGKISSLDVKDLFVRTGNGTSLSGSLYASGLPKIQETFLNLRLKLLTTTASDIRNFAPTFSDKIPVNVNALGNIHFSGNLDGFISDFVAHGNLATDIGKAQSDLNFKYNAKNGASAYSGDLHLEQFDFGKWFNDTTIGTASATAHLNGKGVKLSTLDSKIEGTLDSFVYKKYVYQNIKVNGRLKNKSFEGIVISTDPNVDVMFHGFADLSRDVPEFNFVANVQNISLKALNFTKADYALKGSMSANFTGKNIDDLNGTLEINNIAVRREEERQNIRNITVEALERGNNTYELSFSTDRAEASIVGNYSLRTLPKVLKNYFYKTVYLIDDTSNLPKQDFTFNFEIDDSLPLLRLIDPNIKNIGSSYLRGSLNSERETLNIRGFIPELKYSNYRLQSINIAGDINKQSTVAVANIDRLFSGDSLLLDTVALNLHDVKNGYFINTQIYDSKKFNRVNADVLLRPNIAYADLGLVDMIAWLGGNQWTVSQGNNIRLAKEQLDIENLVFNSDKQRVAIESYRKNEDKESCIRVKLDETSLGDFVALFSAKMRGLQATLSGDVAVENIFGKPIVLADATISNIQIWRQKIGTLALKSALNSSLNRIELNAALTGDSNSAVISGIYDLAKDKQRLDVNVDVKTASLSFLNLRFFEKYVRDVNGTFNGNLHLAGPLKALDLDGSVHINQASVTVSYLNTRYSMDNEDIVLSKDGYFDLGELLIRDTKNNTATGTGRIYHTHFKQFRLALNVNARNTMMLNTTAKENTVFYGQIFGTGNIKFAGVIPEVDITANARLTGGTHCYIPINSSYETNRYSFYNFVDKKADSLKTVKHEQVKLKGVNLRITAEVTPESTVDIILDPVTGDILSVNGSAPSLSIELLRSGEFNIRGLYEISRGNYLFTLQDIVNKRFQLNQGGTINFTGSIYKAQLNADAVYNVRTSMYDLIYDPSQVQTGFSSDVEARAKNRIITKLLLKLTGVLEKPNIAFDIVPQDVDPLIRSLVEAKLAVIRNTESELNKQAFGLLVMNRFIPSSISTQSSVANSSYLGGSAVNTIGEFLSSQVARYMGTFFESVGVQGLDINLNFQQYDQQNQNPNNNNGQVTPVTSYDTRRELQLALTKRFFNNRLSISAGGNVDFGDRTTSGSGTPSTAWTTNVNGDFQVEYALTKSGNLRARAFNRGMYDNLRQNNVNKTGVGISYRQDFDTLREIFRRKKKKQNTTTPPANVPATQDSTQEK